MVKNCKEAIFNQLPLHGGVGLNKIPSWQEQNVRF
jgi:hypothetical protein